MAEQFHFCCNEIERSYYECVGWGGCEQIQIIEVNATLALAETTFNLDLNNSSLQLIVRNDYQFDHLCSAGVVSITQESPFRTRICRKLFFVFTFKKVLDVINYITI